MEWLLLSENDISENTILGGNIDIDKFKFCIQDAQISVLEEILGTELYAKIKTEHENGTLTGSYLALYGIIKPFLVHQSALEYLKIGAYTVSNGGIYKHTPQNGTPAEKSEVDTLVSNQKYKAGIYQQRLEKWLCKNGNELPEFNYNNDIVNPKKQSYGSWYYE